MPHGTAYGCRWSRCHIIVERIPFSNGIQMSPVRMLTRTRQLSHDAFDHDLICSYPWWCPALCRSTVHGGVKSLTASFDSARCRTSSGSIANGRCVMCYCCCSVCICLAAFRVDLAQVLQKYFHGSGSAVKTPLPRLCILKHRIASLRNGEDAEDNANEATVAGPRHGRWAEHGLGGVARAQQQPRHASA